MRSEYTVTQVNAYIKNMFTQDFLLRSITVKGEISNCRYHPSGHIYFTMKDSGGAISCVIALWITTMYEINNDYINLVIRTLISFGTYVLVLLLTHDDLLYSIVKRFMQKR